MQDKLKDKFDIVIRTLGYNIGKFLAFIGHTIEKIRSKKSERKEIMSPRAVLISGASSGLGAELARQYASPGVFLFLTGRHGNRLAKVAAECVAKGAKVETRVMDICDDVSVEKWIMELPRLDLVIANAGVSGGTAEGVDNDEVREIFSVNVGGTLNLILPYIEKARKQALVDGARGHIAIISSIAGMRGLPSAPAYSASKACLSAYADGLRGSLQHEKIIVSAINPGYIRTPLTDTNNFKMPFLLEVDEAAYKIRRALWKRKTRYYFPRPMYMALGFANLLPFYITDKIFRRFPKK